MEPAYTVYYTNDFREEVQNKISRAAAIDASGGITTLATQPSQRTKASERRSVGTKINGDPCSAIWNLGHSEYVFPDLGLPPIPEATFAPQEVYNENPAFTQEKETDSSSTNEEMADKMRKREITLEKKRLYSRMHRKKKKKYIESLERREMELQNHNRAMIEEIKALKELITSLPLSDSIDEI